MSVNPQGDRRLPPQTDVMHVAQFRVKQYTAFTWDTDDGRDREPMVAKAAEMFERTLRARYEQLDCQVRLVRQGSRPQLVFEATVNGETQNDAIRRALYRFEKGLQTKIPDEGRTVQLTPPWGHAVAERLDHG